jgi:hypothetical protein
MRIVGVFAFIGFGAATAYAVHASFTRRRPLDLLFGLVAPVALIGALVGILLLFVPGFFAAP